MSSSTIGVIIIILAYLALMIVVGGMFSKKNKSASDFYLGGRKLGPLVTAMSAEASDMSGWLLMGLPGLALASGIAEPFWTALGLGIGTYFNWLIVAARLRHYSERIGAITVPDFFSKRFNSKLIVFIAALIIVVFFVPYTASGFSACGKLFASLFGVDYVPAMIVSAIIIFVYTMLGGFLAASTTDLIQSIFMTIALIIVLFFGISKVGGLNEVINAANSNQNVAMLSISYPPLSKVSLLAWGLGYFGMPHILLRFMAIEDPKKIKTSRRIATVWVFISMAVAIFIGVVGYCMVTKGIVAAGSDFDSERILIYISNILKEHGVLAIIAAGVILAGIFACTMSTADSQLLAASSSVSENMLKETFGIKISDKTTMIVARVTVAVISLLGVIIALNKESKVFDIVSFAWGGFGATFAPVMFAALFWRRANKYGVLAGMISGGIFVFFYKFIVRVKFAGTVLDVYELLPAFLVASFFLIIVSLLTPAPEKSITDTFDELKAK